MQSSSAEHFPYPTRWGFLQYIANESMHKTAHILWWTSSRMSRIKCQQCLHTAAIHLRAYYSYVSSKLLSHSCQFKVNYVSAYTSSHSLKHHTWLYQGTKTQTFEMCLKQAAWLNGCRIGVIGSFSFCLLDHMSYFYRPIDSKSMQSANLKQQTSHRFGYNIVIALKNSQTIIIKSISFNKFAVQCLGCQSLSSVLFVFHRLRVIM